MHIHTTTNAFINKLYSRNYYLGIGMMMMMTMMAALFFVSNIIILRIIDMDTYNKF